MDEAICNRDQAEGAKHKELQRVVDLLKKHIDEYVDQDLEDEEEAYSGTYAAGDEYTEHNRSLQSFQSAEIRKLQNILKILSMYAKVPTFLTTACLVPFKLQITYGTL